MAHALSLLLVPAFGDRSGLQTGASSGVLESRKQKPRAATVTTRIHPFRRSMMAVEDHSGTAARYMNTFAFLFTYKRGVSSQRYCE